MTSRRLNAPLRIAAFGAVAAAACVLNQLQDAYAVEIHGWLGDHAPVLQFAYVFFIKAVPGAAFFFCCWRIWIAVREIRRTRGQTAIAPAKNPKG